MHILLIIGLIIVAIAFRAVTRSKTLEAKLERRWNQR